MSVCYFKPDLSIWSHWGC